MPDARTVRRFIVYAGVGAIGTGAQYAVLIALVRTGWTNPVTGSMIGAAVGAVVNYGLNRRVTFRTAATHSTAMPKFATIALLGVGANGLLMKLFSSALGLNYLVAQVMATGLVLGLTYGLNASWTFKDRSPEAV
jgi:putative flippase GtrA